MARSPLEMMEPPELGLPAPRQAWRALDRHSIANGITAWLMACTGAFAVMLNVAVDAGISAAEIGSWVLGGFGFGGLMSVAFSLVYRMPMGMAWTIPGAILLGGALEHLPFAECLGAFYVTGALITVLGVTGWFARLAALIPPNVVMAMVAGVFLPFVVKIVTGFAANWLAATVTVVAFVAVAAWPRAARAVPPILVAIAAGAMVVVASGHITLEAPLQIAIVSPVVLVPAFSWPALVELVIPLAITVVGIQNLQGFAVCEANGYNPPRNTLTTACGLGTFAFALVGTVPTCVTGPANAILNSSGLPERRYMGGVVFGLLMFGFGLFAPFTTALALALPAAFIGIVGGLAMFEVLRGAFTAAFSGRVSSGALTTFIVTVADQPIANIGAPFWAVVFGLAVYHLFDEKRG